MYGYSYPSYSAVQVSPWPQTPRAHTGWQAATATPARLAPQRSTMTVRRTLCVLSGPLDGGASFADTYNALRDPAGPRDAAE